MAKRALWLTVALAVIAASVLPGSGSAAPANVGVIEFLACNPKKVPKKAGRAIILKWLTASEPNTVGFNVYRQVGSKFKKLNRTLISARGIRAGAKYRWPDKLPSTQKGRICYRLEAVSDVGTNALLRNACSRSCLPDV